MRVREQRVVECPTPQLQALDGAMDRHTVHVPAWRAPLAAGNTEVYAMGWAGICLTPGSREGREDRW